MSRKTNHHHRPWRARPLRSSRALILMLALLLHAAFLLVPLRQANTPAPRQSLEVELWARQPATAVEPEHAPETPVPPPEEPNIAEEAIEPEVEAVAISEPAPVEPPARRVVTTVFLLDAASRMQWKEPEQQPEMLGVARHAPLPANLVGRVMPLTPNWFDTMVAPREVEIFDRWRESDGSMQVVMRTPTGDTLCGRRDTWDPLNPLVEPVMMFRTCAGGGSRIKPAP